MTSRAPEFTESDFLRDIEISAQNFRAERLAPSNAWKAHYEVARQKFQKLFKEFNDLQFQTLDEKNLAAAFKGKLSDKIRYLSGPPISEDDLKILAEVDSLAPGVLVKDAGALRKVFGIIERVIDPYRFPWVVKNRKPTRNEKSAALMASAVLFAAQSLATERRMSGKSAQESLVKKYLSSIGFTEVKPEIIKTLVKGPKEAQFCGECLLGERKADIVVRLYDTRLLAIECKVSNSVLNSVKRINNDAAAKAKYWLDAFGRNQVVPAAAIAGVFKMENLKQAQAQGLDIYWSHDLDRLGSFINSTRK